jgi:hypothetical protein
VVPAYFAPSSLVSARVSGPVKHEHGRAIGGVDAVGRIVRCGIDVMEGKANRLPYGRTRPPQSRDLVGAAARSAAGADAGPSRRSPAR